MNLLTLFAIGRERQPDKVAIEFKDTRGPLGPLNLTFAELHREVGRWAAAFARMGVKKGDRVGLYLCNRPEFVIAYLATLEVGAIMVPINLRYRRRELSHILNDAEPVLLVIEDEHWPVLDEIVGIEIGPDLTVLSVDRSETGWKRLTARSGPARRGRLRGVRKPR